ncbi:MAG: SDR family oxidoreductase [Synergistetes bacterium]|nr:SDR family oxidoreductase [Synergistota bacterium]
MISFSNKVALITGGGRGIGRVTALLFSQLGASVVILELLEREGKETLKQIESNGGRGIFIKTDVSNIESVRKAIAITLEKYGKIDILVNNAGIVYTKPFVECTPEEWERVIAVNLMGVFNTCLEVFPHMIKQKSGKIVNVASIAGKRGGGIFGNAIYSASKGGVIAFTKALAREGGPHGINVNAVCPGPTETKMLSGLPNDKRKALIENIPLRQFGKPENVAHAIIFLSSEMANHITGEIMDVDGGLTMD